MDHVKPTGLRGLWRDKRNMYCSLILVLGFTQILIFFAAFWTFWLVVRGSQRDPCRRLTGCVGLADLGGYHPVAVGG